ncbi:MAG: hypothetical protein JNL08_09010 [Planctomycetes bacterium]|nr:hypothetical protein [Planctomycetota bacterium]
MRSDGHVVAWADPAFVLYGETTIPPSLTQWSVAKVAVGTDYSMALKHDGTIVAWGYNANGQCNVPQLPAGVVYVDLYAGQCHAVALRSDGQVVAWGDNADGQCNVPPLPTGQTYVMAAAGKWHSSALRSDGVFITWGDQSLGQGNAPTIPAGDVCIQLACGTAHSVALLRSGTVLVWGLQEFLQGPVPLLPSVPRPSRFLAVSAGAYHNVAVTTERELVGWGRDINGVTQVPTALQSKRWLAVGCGELHTVALAHGGQLLAWGDNTAGQCNVPPLPAGVTYTPDFWVGPGHTVARRSDGTAVAFGDNTAGCSNIPAPPAGVTYVHADLNYSTTLLVRSDGQITGVGSNWNGQLVAPPLPPGLRYVEVAAAYGFSAALRSDGSVVHWGTPPAMPLPTLPFGVSYVQMDAGEGHIALRRSDGMVDPIGRQPGIYGYIPPLDPGTSYVEITAAWLMVTARVGPTCTYVSFAPGCAGSRPPTRLIPRDTPHLGKTLQVTLFDLPVDVAFLVFGWQRLPNPVDLGFVGMPGCNLHVSLDAIVPVVGAGTQAKWLLPIPADPVWVGTRFYNQALVLDPLAGNGFGAVTSDAAEAVIGHW